MPLQNPFRRKKSEKPSEFEIEPEIEVKYEVSQDQLKRYIQDSFSNVIALRKINSMFNINENDSVYYIRPQMNITTIMPFSTLKSNHIIFQLKKKLGNDIIHRDTLTPASLLGTIDRKGNYIHGVLADSGGKIDVVDEWNSLKSDVRETLLGPLQNQEIHKELAFIVKESITITNRYTNIKVERGLIEGKVYSSFLLFGMYVPKTEKFDKALASRARPIYVNSEEIIYKDIYSGNVQYVFEDKAQEIDMVDITQNSYQEFIDYFFAELAKKGIMPKGEEQGFIGKTKDDMIRDAVAFRIRHEQCDKRICIDNSEELIKNFEYGFIQLSMYSKKADKLMQLITLIFTYPHKGIEWYSKKLDISQQYFNDLRVRWEIQSNRYLPYKLSKEEHSRRLKDAKHKEESEK